MKRQKSTTAKRRITVTLPSDCVAEVVRKAEAEHVSVSTIVARALSNGTATNGMKAPEETFPRTPERVEEILESYRRAYEGFSEEELLMLQGIVMKPIGPDNPDPDDD